MFGEGESKVILIRRYLLSSISIMFVPTNKVIRLIFITTCLDIFRLILVYTSVQYQVDEYKIEHYRIEQQIILQMFYYMMHVQDNSRNPNSQFH